MTKFIYQNQERQFKVQKGQLFQVLIPRIRQQFGISSSKQIIFCHFPIHNEYISGVMLQSPLKVSLQVIYCYVVSPQQYKNNFLKIILLDDLGDDNSQLEFMIYKQLTVSDLFQIYKFTKSLKMKHCRFKMTNTGQEVSHDTKIGSLPDRVRLKVAFDLYKIIFMKDGEGIDKAKIPRSYFRNTARELLRKIEPKLAQENQHANICFNYYGVDIPERQLVIPEDGEDIIISIQSIKNGINVTVIDQLSRRPIITKVVLKQSIFYRTAKEIFNSLMHNFDYDSFSFENFLEDQKYYKKGDNIVIIAGKAERDEINIDIPAVFPLKDKDNHLQTLKRELRSVFGQRMQQKDENKLVLDLVGLYSRALMDQ